MGTRPITDRVKESIFNILGSRLGTLGRLPDLRVLDLFAGAGSFGLEALSRGARSCLFVERGRTALPTLRENIRALGLRPDEATISTADAWTITYNAPAPDCANSCSTAALGCEPPSSLADSGCAPSSSLVIPGDAPPCDPTLPGGATPDQIGPPGSVTAGRASAHDATPARSAGEPGSAQSPHPSTFDLIFIDPPYRDVADTDRILKRLDQLASALADGGLIVFRHERDTSVPADRLQSLAPLDQRDFGSMRIHWLARA